MLKQQRSMGLSTCSRHDDNKRQASRAPPPGGGAFPVHSCRTNLGPSQTLRVDRRRPAVLGAHGSRETVRSMAGGTLPAGGERPARGGEAHRL